MCLTQSQWEELFRVGFQFSLMLPDGTLYKEFTEIDLAENRQEKWVAKYPRLAGIPRRPPKTVDELFKNPYGVMSFPPRYGYPRINVAAVDNPHILSWWSEAHDELLARQTARDGWNWWPSTSALARMTDNDVFTQWQIEDPKCLDGNWADVLAEFSRACSYGRRRCDDRPQRRTG